MLQQSRMLALVVLVLIATAPASGADAYEAADEKLLKDVGHPVDGPGLLALFKARTSANAEHIKAMTAQLGKDEPALANAAVLELIRIGPAALPELKKAQQSTDLRVKLNANKCMRAIDKGGDLPLVLAAARLLSSRQPEGAVETLLRFFPGVKDESVRHEVLVSLERLGFKKGAATPELLEGLQSSSAGVRGVVVNLLAQGGPVNVDKLKPILQDKTPAVRFQAALALGNLREASAMPVLCDALAEAALDQAKDVEEFLRDLAGRRAPAQRLGTTMASRQQCKKAWLDWWTAVDDKALLDHFRDQTLTDQRRKQILDLIRQQGDDSFILREEASNNLVEMGSAAIPLLQQALDSSDAEVVERTERCIDRIGKSKAINPAEASRLLALRKPDQAAAVLLGYVPFAHDDESAQEIQSALNALAYLDGAPNPDVLAGLGNEVAVRRANAAVALSRYPAGRTLAKVRALLQDKDETVRRELALSLVSSHDKEGVPVLIDLIANLPREKRWEIEDVLFRLAGEKAPPAPSSDDARARQQYQQAWVAWWKREEAGIDLARLDSGRRLIGHTLLVLPTNGRVVEIGRDGKTRWQVNGLQHPFDAEMLPGGRILVAEYLGKRVTERDLKGKILWQRAANNPISCQRLTNGNTFIATRRELFEVDRNGKQIFHLQRPSDVMSARKTRDGKIAVLTNRQRLQRLDTKGKVLKDIGIGPVSGYVQFDLTPDGGVLVPQTNSNQVVEYDADGKVRWQARVTNPFSAEKLPNGRVLVSCMNQSKVVELDRTGKTVWEQRTGGPSWRARRR